MRERERWQRERHEPCGRFHPRYCDDCGNETCINHECSWSWLNDEDDHA